MAYQIALTQPRYHHSTDALCGSSTQLLTELGTFETFDWASTKAWLLAEECGYDSDFSFTVRDTANLRVTVYHSRVGVIGARRPEYDEIPF